jgi:hypothetical protein
MEVESVVMRLTFRVGDVVEIPWLAGRTTTAEILEIYGPSGTEHAYVRVAVRGADDEPIGEERMSLPLTELKLAHAAP